MKKALCLLSFVLIAYFNEHLFSESSVSTISNENKVKELLKDKKLELAFSKVLKQKKVQNRTLATPNIEIKKNIIIDKQLNPAEENLEIIIIKFRDKFDNEDQKRYLNKIKNDINNLNEAIAHFKELDPGYKTEKLEENLLEKEIELDELLNIFNATEVSSELPER